MKGVLSSKHEGTKKKQDTKSIILKYIIYPIRSGIGGFASFFVVLAAAKYLGSIIRTSESFIIDAEDFLLSLMGFILVFLIKFLGNFSQSDQS